MLQFTRLSRNTLCFIFGVILSVFFAFPGHAHAQNINLLEQFVATTSPSSAITQRIFGKTLRLSGSQYSSLSCLGTDVNGIVGAGTCTGGGGGSSFSTTSANFWASLGLAFSTTSADAWKAQRNFFSTTSADYYTSLGLSFSTTSADAWKATRNFFSTTSASYFSSLGLAWATSSADAYRLANNFFSTTSATYFTSLGLSFSTTSADAWRLTKWEANYPFINNATSSILTFSGGTLTNGSTTINGNATTTGTFFAGTASSTNTFGAGLTPCTGSNFLQWSAGLFSCTTPTVSPSFSTTSANYWASLGLAFSTTSNDYWKSVNNFFSTTSATFFSAAGLAFSTTSSNYWSSLGLGWATSSATAWSAAGLGFSTTSSTYWSSLGLGFSTTSALNWANSRGYIGTSSQDTAGQVMMFTTTNSNQPKASGTTTNLVSCTGTVSCTPFTVFSATAITLTGSASGGAAYSFTPLSNFATGTSATSTPIWGRVGIFASSTSQFDNSTTTNATIGSLWLPSIVTKVLQTDALGNVSGTTTALATCAGSVACTPFMIFNATPITLTGTDIQFSTTSANFWASLGLAWATSSADAYRLANNFFSTTSANFWSAAGLGFSTTSANFWSLAGLGFSTTSANYWSSLGLGFSTSSANGYVATKWFNTFPFTPTADGNATGTALMLGGGFISQASSTFNGNATTTGTFYATNASSTKTFGAGLSQCNSANQALNWNAGIFSCATISASGSVGNWFTPDTWGTFAPNSTSTIVWFKNGIIASSTAIFDNSTTTAATTTNFAATGYATSSAMTVSNIARVGTLVVTGVGTVNINPTGYLRFSLTSAYNTASSPDIQWNASAVPTAGINNPSGNVLQFINGTTEVFRTATANTTGFSSSSPYAKLSIQGNANDAVLQKTLFAIGSSTASATTTLFNVQNTGAVGVGDSSPDFTLETAGSIANGYFGVTNTTDGDIFQITSGGNVGIASTTPGTLFSVGGNAVGFNMTAATSTWNTTGGVNLISGCYAIRGACLSTGITSISGPTGIVWAGTPAVTGTLSAGFSLRQLPSYTVGSSGASFTTIQAALDACGGTGGNIYLTDTSYAQAGTGLLWKGSNCHLWGRGAGTTTIAFTGATTGFKTNSAASKFNNNSITGVSLNGDGTTGSIGIDMSDMSHARYEDIDMDNWDTGVQAVDTQNITFYNHFVGMTMTTLKTSGINASSTKPVNDNLFEDMFIGCSNVGTCTGIRINNAQANNFTNVTIEPAGTAAFGIKISSNSLATNNGTFANNFYNVYIEGNKIGVSASSTDNRSGNAAVHGNNFYGGQIETNTANVLFESADQIEGEFHGTEVNFASTNTLGPLTILAKNRGNMLFLNDQGFSNMALFAQNNTNFAHNSLDFTKLALLNAGDSSNLLNLNNAGTGATILATSSRGTDFMLSGLNGRVGIGTSTPWGRLSVLETANPTNNPIFAVATSSDPLGQLMTLFGTSTTLTANKGPLGVVADSGARLGIGIFSYRNFGGLLDQLTVNGRINTGEWAEAKCDAFVFNTTFSSDTATGCEDQWQFQNDTSGSMNGQNSTNGINYIALALGTATTNSGPGLFASGFPSITVATNTPVMEALVRIENPQNSTTTSYFVGLTDINPAGTSFEVDPTGGCYFTASSTQPNWQAVCRTSATAITQVNTGIASSTTLTGAGKFMLLRIEADRTTTRFYIASSTDPLRLVATITTNRPTLGLTPGVYYANGATAGSAINFDIVYLDYWGRHRAITF